jgi:hypothetical protein
MYFILWILYHLYDFDFFTNLVYDTIYILALCILKKYVHLLMQFLTDLDKDNELEGALQIVSQPACTPKWLGQ